MQVPSSDLNGSKQQFDKQGEVPSIFNDSYDQSEEDRKRKTSEFAFMKTTMGVGSNNNLMLSSAQVNRNSQNANSSRGLRSW